MPVVFKTTCFELHSSSSGLFVTLWGSVQLWTHTVMVLVCLLGVCVYWIFDTKITQKLKNILQKLKPSEHALQSGIHTKQEHRINWTLLLQEWPT